MLLVCVSLIVSLTCCNYLSVSATTYGCKDISGRWYNQLGSQIEIDHTSDGRLRGKFYTRVSRTAASLQGHDFVGSLPYNVPGASFAFSVTWNNGASTTVWVGQCQVCDGQDILETSWLLRSFVDSCIDIWKSTLIGKDKFYRKISTGESRQLRSIRDTSAAAAANQYLSSDDNPCSNIQGIWYNDVGSEIILNQSRSGDITGEYRTAVEVEKGSAGKTHSLIYGSSAFGNPNTTFSLMVVWRNGASVTGWVGQCHVCGENNTAVLETIWLLRSRIESCNGWKSTLNNANTFTRHEQKSGPRKSKGSHTPNRDGEDNGETGSSSRFFVQKVLLVLLLLVHAW